MKYGKNLPERFHGRPFYGIVEMVPDEENGQRAEIVTHNTDDTFTGLLANYEGQYVRVTIDVITKEEYESDE